MNCKVTGIPAAVDPHYFIWFHDGILKQKQLISAGIVQHKTLYVAVMCIYRPCLYKKLTHIEPNNKHFNYAYKAIFIFFLKKDNMFQYHQFEHRDDGIGLVTK